MVSPVLSPERENTLTRGRAAMVSLFLVRNLHKSLEANHSAVHRGQPTTSGRPTVVGCNMLPRYYFHRGYPCTCHDAALTMYVCMYIWYVIHMYRIHVIHNTYTTNMTRESIVSEVTDSHSTVLFTVSREPHPVFQSGPPKSFQH